MSGLVQAWDSEVGGTRSTKFVTSPTRTPYRIIESSLGIDGISRFRKLVDQWRAQTVFVSSIEDMVQHAAFREIVEMGDEIIPEILDEIRVRPDFLFLALQIITGENPVSSSFKGSVTDAVDAWLQWGDRKNIRTV